jgi:hypothetical protein
VKKASFSSEFSEDVLPCRYACKRRASVLTFARRVWSYPFLFGIIPLTLSRGHRCRGETVYLAFVPSSYIHRQKPERLMLKPFASVYSHLADLFEFSCRQQPQDSPMSLSVTPLELEPAHICDFNTSVFMTHL